MAIEVYPVIHVTKGSDAPKISTEQVAVARDHGAHGVYIIDHNSGTVDALLECFNSVTEAYPDFFIGLNFLQHASAFDGFNQLLEWEKADLIGRLPNGLWVDAAHNLFQKTVELRQANPELLAVKYLGGVAFKHTFLYTNNPAKAAADAEFFSPYVDVVTTSGVRTGEPASPEKANAMKRVIGNQPLALASGVDANNIHLYTGVNEVLVSTSIETSPQSGRFDLSALSELVDAATHM